MYNCIKSSYYLIIIAVLVTHWTTQAQALLFVSNQDGDREIFTVGLQGNGLKQLTHNNRDDYQAIWSPDGQQIAFTSLRDGGNSEIYVMNADGSEQRNISHSKGFDGSPTWSPDSKYITFCSDRKMTIQLFSIELASSKTTQLTDGKLSNCDATWSPDGNWIAYRKLNKKQNADIYLSTPDGQKIRQITNNPKSNDDAITWSPDGMSLAYHSRRNRVFNIYTYDLKTNIEKQLTDLSSLDTSPQWSKDGGKILFLSARDSDAQAETFVMNADGAKPVNLSKGGHFEEYASWSSDGKYILVSSYRDGGVSNLYRMKSEGGQQVRISAAKGYQSQPMARPTLFAVNTSDTTNKTSKPDLIMNE